MSRRPATPRADRVTRRRPAASFALTVLRRTRLIGPAFRGLERWQTWRSQRRRDPSAVLGPDGLPLPPQRLVVLVAGPTSIDTFLAKGRVGAAIVRDAVERQGVQLGDLSAMLDFGVGCGRVARHWSDLQGPEIHGCDLNEELVAWTDANLPFVRARLTQVGPPLPYDEGRFDLVYAFSVFTHLPEHLQHAWSEELGRVIRPGGHLVISTHGAAYGDRLTSAERGAFARGQLIVHFEELAGANLCSTFHPDAYVRDQFDERFELVESVREGAPSNGRQDLHVLRRRALPT